MKAITVRLSDEDYEALRYSAYVTRESVGAKAGQYLTAALKKTLTGEKKDIQPKVDEVPKRGIDVAMSIPANTEVAAKERLKEMEGKKAARMNTGESEAEFLKRQEAATRSMEKRYGK